LQEQLMIRVFTDISGPGASPAVDNMFRDRKRVFVDLLKWNVPVVAGEFEVDQFDTGHAVYLVHADEHSRHLGSMRLLSTDRAHLLGSLFPYLSDGVVPTGRDILEITRGCLAPDLRAAERLRVRNGLITAAVRYGLLRGIRSFTCVADSGWLRQIPGLGWDCAPLGAPRPVGGVLTGALKIDLNERTVATLQASGIYRSAPLVMADALTPLAA
jgi:N-acyl-L-homoserine lactone synthetase